MASSSDPAYKLLLAQPRMVEDILRGFIAPEWCGQLDFPTLTQTNAEYIGADLHRRIGDMVWRVGFKLGEYRIKRAILDIYDAIQVSIATGGGYRTAFDPPPR